MKMNWNVMVSSRNRKRVSRSMMTKAKNIIMEERIWITVKLTLGGLIPGYCAGPGHVPHDWRVSAFYHEKGRPGSNMKQFKRNPVCT